MPCKINNIQSQIFGNSSEQLVKILQEKLFIGCREKIERKPVKPKRKFKPHPNNVLSDSSLESPKINYCWSSDSNITLKPKVDVPKLRNVEWEMQNAFENIGDVRRSTNEIKVIYERNKNADKMQISNVKKAVQPKELESRFSFAPKKSKIVFVENIDEKLKGILNKIFTTIEDVSAKIDEGITLPDGDEDYERRKKRATEFSSRFSRNYLYQLSRDTADLQNSNSNSCTNMMQRKLVSSHQIILQGLQAYLSHVHSTLPNIVTGKIKELIEKSSNLCEIHLKMLNSNSRDSIHNINEDLIHDFMSRLRDLSDKIQNSDAETAVTLLKSSGTKVSLPLHRNERSKVKSTGKKHDLKSRYSMYTESACFHREIAWKKVAANLTNKKFKVQSRYKTATFKHRPIQEKPHIVQLPTKNKLFAKCSSNCIPNTPIQTVIREEDIVTMVEIDNKKEVSEKPSNLREMLQELVENEDMTQEKLKDVMCNILGMVPDQTENNANGSVEKGTGKYHKLEESLNCVKSDENCRDFAKKIVEFARENIGRKNGEIESDHKQLKKKLSISEFGPKNARLICIKDDNSIIENSEESTNEEENIRNTEIINVCSETQTDTDYVQGNNCENSLIVANYLKKKIKSNIKISRLPKENRKSLELLPKDYMINIIQYKLDLHKHSKGNHMYRRSASIKPWVLLGKLSDNILDDLLLSVAREIELNDILEKLYQAEFQ